MLWVFRGQGSDDLRFDTRQVHRVLSVVKERFPDDWHPFRDDVLPDDERVGANFLLGMCIHSQMEEVEQIVEINLPVCLGIRRKREILPRLLTRHAGRDPCLVDSARLLLERLLCR